MFWKVHLKGMVQQKYLLNFAPVYDIIGFRNVCGRVEIMSIEDVLDRGIADVEIEGLTVNVQVRERCQNSSKRRLLLKNISHLLKEKARGVTHTSYVAPFRYMICETISEPTHL